MIYRFGDCKLESAQCMLSRAGQCIRLQPKVCQVLAYLLQHSDRVVTRQELCAAVWPDLLGRDAALESTIRAVRHAVGDTGGDQRVIQTWDRHGYRVVLPVEAAAEPDDAAPAVEPLAATSPDSSDPEPTAAPPQPDASLPSVAEAERRQLTVLFCDLVSSTALSTQLEMEDYLDVIRRYQAACADVIQRWNGYIAQYLGDGVLVYFGYPLAHEDDSRRAVYAGLGIVDALAALNRRLEQEHGVRLTARLGVHTGPVIIGAMGTGARQELLAVGETPNLAAQIQTLAPPNTVVISDVTYRLITGYFICRPMILQEIKGLAKPVTLYQVQEETGARGRLDITEAAALTPLVGREMELNFLLDRWSQVKRGWGQVVLLVGDAGMGKSRLVRALHDQIATEDHFLLDCRCSPYHQHSALYPVIEMLQRRLKWQAGDPLDLKQQKLDALLIQHKLPMADMQPLLSELLALPRSVEPDSLSSMTPMQKRQKTLEALLTLVLEVAAQRPVLFMIDDLHWIDPSTLEFLTLLVDRLPRTSVYALMTTRPTFQSPWEARSFLTQLTLSRLPQGPAEAMVAQLAKGKPLPAEVLQQVIQRTDGVPLFVEECTKAVLEGELLHETDHQYQLITPLPHLAIPVTLSDSLMARLDRLDSAKRVAQLGAVIGRQFEYTLLRAVWEQDERRLQQELDLLIKAELIYQQGMAPRATYIFKHALIQEAAYQSLLRSTRRRYHQRIAQTLHTQFPDTAASEPELLAHHYTEAGLAPEAVPYWQSAGWKALQSSAHQEAVAHFRKGLEVLSGLPETPERNRLELDLQIALGPALMATQGFSAPDLIQTYARAHELCHHAEATPQSIQALMGLWQFYLTRSELDKAQELASQLHRLAQPLQDLSLLPTVYRTLGETLVWQGEFYSARTFLEQGVAIYDPQQHGDHALRDGLDPGVACLGFLAWCLWHLGYPDQAMKKQHEALALARDLSHPFSLAFALCTAAVCFDWCGDLAAVRAYSDEAIALATEQGFPFWSAIGMATSGFAKVCLDQATAGMIQLRQGFDLYRATGSKAAQLWFLNILTRAALRMNHLDEAHSMSNAAMTFMETTEERFFEVETYWLQGKLRLAQATSAHQLRTLAPDIEACLVRAQDAARRQHMKSWELRIVMSLRELWQSQGRSDDAQKLLAEVYETFTEGWDTADLQQAKALLAAST